jgi:hypothetical protein
MYNNNYITQYSHYFIIYSSHHAYNLLSSTFRVTSLMVVTIDSLAIYSGSLYIFVL